MKLIVERLKLPVAFALVSSFNFRQWYFWNPFFILVLAAGWAILYSIMRRDGDRSPIIAFVASATAVLAILVLELLFLVFVTAAYGYIRHSLSRA